MTACAAFTRQRPPARSSAQQRLPARQCAARASGAAGQAAPCTRRGAVAGLALLPALALQLGGTEARAEGPTVQLNAAPAAAVAAAAAEEAAAAVAAPAPWRNYIARDFSFSYPPGLKVIEEDIFAATVPGRPRSTLDAVVENPVKAQLLSADGQEVVSVVVKLASTIKPTVLQLTDITQWGDPREVARLLLPPGAVVSEVTSTTVPRPPKQGPFGPIERDPFTIYSYSVVLPDKEQTHVSMSVGAQKGQVYVLGASAPQALWAQVAADLQQCAGSFRLIL